VEDVTGSSLISNMITGKGKRAKIFRKERKKKNNDPTYLASYSAKGCHQGNRRVKGKSREGES